MPRRVPSRKLASAVAMLAILWTPTAESADAMAPDSPGRALSARPGTNLASTAPITRTELRRGLARQLRRVGGSSGAWVYDIDATSDPELFSRGARDRRILASNEKLFTTGAALARFGGGKRFTTAVYARGRRTGKGDRVLDGNLIIVGAGDPALGTGRFAREHHLPLTNLRGLAAGVAGAGIARIAGDVRVDDSVFDRRRGVAATGWGPDPYLSPLSGLSFNSGYNGEGYSRNPELLAARELRRLLRRQGVAVEGEIARADAGRNLLESGPLAAVRSPALRRLIEETNETSNNFFAEVLLKRLAARRDRRGTTTRGAKRVEAFADKLGTGVRAEDGSGLSRGNRATARQVGKLLVAMRASGNGAASFFASLPVAGREGTLAERMRGTAAEGDCRAKTGTLSGVSNLSGYCEAGHGLVAFSILMNDVGVEEAQRAQDKMSALIARYRP